MSELWVQDQGARLKVLVVEDEVLVAMVLEEMLCEMGCDVVGPFGSLASALTAARSETYDVAVIDLDLAGEKADEVITLMAARQIPHAIATGYDTTFGHRPTVLLDKPYTLAELEEAVSILRSSLDQNSSGVSDLGDA